MTATNKSPYKKPKHVLLTGATGYIGKRLIPALVEQQIRVTCLIRHQEMADEFTAMNCNVMVCTFSASADMHLMVVITVSTNVLLPTL